ncbi:MAG: hypothetical protein ISR47_07785 [Rhodospirillales bacterium]|nr:hypothetical protein [Rhodospirillales bacterium]
MRVVGIFVVFLSAVFFCGPILAEEKSGAETPGNPHVRLSSFLAPGRNANGERVNIPMTLVFEIIRDADVKQFCWMSPRILDAVMQDVFKKPITVRDSRTLDLSILGTRLTTVANKALGKRTIIDTHVFASAMSGDMGKMNAVEWQKCKGAR